MSLVRRQSVPPHRLSVVLRDALAGAVREPEVVLRLSIPCLSTLPQRIRLRRLRLHRRTLCERGQHSDDGNEPDGVRHAGLSVHGDVMSDPILLLAGRACNARAYGSRGCAALRRPRAYGFFRACFDGLARVTHTHPSTPSSRAVGPRGEV